MGPLIDQNAVETYRTAIEDVKKEGGEIPVSYTHLRAHETVLDLVCRLLLEKKKTKTTQQQVMTLNTDDNTNITQ